MNDNQFNKFYIKFRLEIEKIEKQLYSEENYSLKELKKLCEKRSKINLDDKFPFVDAIKKEIFGKDI